MKRLVLVLLALSGGLFSGRPCTTFLLQDGTALYFGRNLDWFAEDGLVIVNPRNVAKTAMVPPGSVGAKWVAKYGSVTFNQFGREMPFGGMNEAGLVVENMQLGETQYPAPDARPGINLLQWMQYQLDTCRTVTEVIATDKNLRIEPLPLETKTSAKAHYLVSDASGDCAVIEYLAGAFVVHHGPNLPYRSLANDPYDHAIEFAKAHPFTATTNNVKVPTSDNRFACAASRVGEFKSASPARDVDYAFHTLNQVHQGPMTVWRMVYDIPNRTVTYQTRSHTQRRVIDLRALDFGCRANPRFVDIQTVPATAGAWPWEELTEARQAQYLKTLMAAPTTLNNLGDLSPLLPGLLLTCRACTCQ